MGETPLLRVLYMKALTKLIEAILAKMGFVGAEVEIIKLDSKPYRNIRFWQMFQ